MSTIYSKLLSRYDFTEALWPKWSKYIPQQPTPKQLAFLLLPNKEAFFGGAAGPGKSSALLMAALQFADVPGYAGIIFRRTLSDLKQANSLLSRAHDWLTGTDAKWSGDNHTYYFPTKDPRRPASLQFAYIGEANASSRYQGIEVQLCCFDELTQHWEEDYLYLFSRLRKLVCPIHKVNSDGSPNYLTGCSQCSQASSVPLRMRSASNPPRAGDRGATGWVKDRFRIKRQSDGSYRGLHPTRPHIPGFLSDNPYIDQASYAENLAELDPVTREQLLRGDWGVSADGRFRKGWMQYYSLNADYVILGRDKRGKPWLRNQCRCFVTVDPAASVKEGPGDADIWRKAPSWTVICVWLVTPDHHLLFWDMVRIRCEIPDIFPWLKKIYLKHVPEYVAIESNGLNLGVYQMAHRIGIPTRPLSPRAQDKVVRSTDIAVRMEAGKVWLPQEGLVQFTKGSLEDVESELFTWTGHPQEPADIVDNFSYAGMEVSRESATYEMSEYYAQDVPAVY